MVLLLQASTITSLRHKTRAGRESKVYEMYVHWKVGSFGLWGK